MNGKRKINAQGSSNRIFTLKLSKNDTKKNKDIRYQTTEWRPAGILVLTYDEANACFKDRYYRYVADYVQKYTGKNVAPTCIWSTSEIKTDITNSDT